MMSLTEGQHRFNRALGYLVVVAFCAAASFIVAWAFRLHVTHDFNVSFCKQQERQNAALRLVLQARLADQGTSEKVKREFRYIIVHYLEPKSCKGLP